eukprot:599431_1
MAKLADQYIALIVYASTYLFLVIAIGVLVYFKRKKRSRISAADKDRSYIETVWFAREIYAAVIVHLYDQATDVAIMVQWGRFLDEELSGTRDLESVNMLSFFVPGVGFIILYRVITMIFAIYEDTKTVEEHIVYRDMEKQKEHERNKKSIWIIIWDIILCFFDLYFIKIVYLEFEAGEFKPNQAHRSLQLCEALFESMPQVVLQSVFLLRYTASVSATDDTLGISLVVVSITASILSIANKYSWFDRQAVVWDAKQLNGGRKGECYISWRFVVRQLWRWSDLCARFVILTLLWVCIGGLYLSIYVCLSYCFYYFVVFDRIGQSHLYRLLATTICIVGIILDYERHFCILRLIDNGVMIGVISIFVFATFDCSDVYCSSNSKREVMNTPIIAVFILMGFVAYAAELITYPILQSHKMQIIKKTLKGRAFFSIILFGDDDAVPCYYLTYFVEGKRGLSVDDINYFTGKKSNDECEKLGELVERVFKSLLDDTGDIQMDTGDVAIDLKVFKYGVSVRCLQNVHHKQNHKPLTGKDAVDFVSSLYDKSEVMSAVSAIFDEHFEARDRKKQWILTFDRDESIFVVLNAEEEEEESNGRHPVVAKYRFGAEFKKYNRDVRIINGHDYAAGLHVTRKQVAIKVIDRCSAKNEDMFRRERINLSHLNPHELILPYIGWDDAHDAYFVVTKRLFGGKIVRRVSEERNTKQLMRYIAQMFSVIAYVHSKGIVMRNISPNSFEFADDGDSMYLVHYENSKQMTDEQCCGNIQQKVLYLSPELCRIVKDRYKSKKWSANISGAMCKASDVWALAILTYYLLLGCHPFFKTGATPNKLKKTLHKIMNHEQFERNLEPFKYEDLNMIFTDFVNKTLRADYSKRLSCEECLSHEFLSRSFLDKLDESERIKKEVVANLAGSVTQSKLHESIARVRAEQIELEEKCDEHHRQSVLIGKIDTTNEVDKMMDFEAEQGMKEQFRKIDLDGDGYTTIDELTKLLTSLGYALHFAQKEAQTIMNELDLDGDGTIDFNEFAMAWVQRKLSINDKYAHAIFNVFDLDGDGFIQKEELKNALFPPYVEEEEEHSDESESQDYITKIFRVFDDERNNEELERIIDEVDENSDGKISFDEFHKAMTDNLNRENKGDQVPFEHIINHISFKQINANGCDPLFENSKDYIKIDDDDDDDVSIIVQQKEDKKIRTPSVTA